MAKIGIIGGSGLENPDILSSTAKLEVSTPFGSPSDTLTVGKINNIDIVLLPRHGKKHSVPPTQINNRANIWALKDLGCTHILVTTACGSMRDEIERGDLVILDQFINFAFRRKLTYFESFPDGEMKHTPMADPFDESMRKVLIDTATDLGLKFHPKGTVITIEGPRFSTRAESGMFRQWGADVINMSTAPEAILANELGIPYAAIAMSTDYDCWKTDEAPVTWESVLKVFNQNVENVLNLIINSIPKIA